VGIESTNKYIQLIQGKKAWGQEGSTEMLSLVSTQEDEEGGRGEEVTSYDAKNAMCHILSRRGRNEKKWFTQCLLRF